MAKKIKLVVGKEYLCTVKKYKKIPRDWVEDMMAYCGKNITCIFRGPTMLFEIKNGRWLFSTDDFSKIREIEDKQP